MTPHDLDWPPEEEQAPSAEELPTDPAPPADPDVDPIAELLDTGPRSRAGLWLAAAVLLLVIVAALRFLIPGAFGGDQPVEPTPAITQGATSTPTAQAASAAALDPLPGVSPSPQDLDVLLSQADSLTERSKFEEAIALYQKLAVEMPDDARPQTGWALALLLDGKPEQALVHALQAVELEPIDAEAMAVLARAYAESGDLAHASGMALNAVQLNPSSAEAHAALAQVYLLQGQDQKAVQETEQALAADPTNAEAHRLRARLYETMDGDLEKAIAELQTAADLQPELWMRQYELGLAQLKARDYEAAVVTLKTALGLRRKAMTYTAVGEAYYGLDQFDRAQAFLQQALSAGAVDSQTYALLAAIDAQQGRCEDARVFVDLALSQDAANRLALEARNACVGASPVPTALPTEPPPTAAAEPPSLSGWIAFPVWNAETNQYDTYVARPDGSERHLAAAEMHQPAFSPDGQWLAINGERHEYLNLSMVHPDGSDLREITPFNEDNLPAWSPDGKSLAFSSTRHSDRQSRVYVIDEVPLDGKRVQGRALTAQASEVFGAYPAWTADGQIVYAGCDYTSTPVECGLFVISAEPGPQVPRLLTTQPEDTAPATSGSRIAFMSSRDGNWELYLVDSSGSGLTRLTNTPVIDGLPTWSPDGRTLAFVSDQGGVWAVWAMNADGSNRRKLFDIGGGGLANDWQHERISWAP